MSLCSGCGNPVIDGTCACPGVVADLKEKVRELERQKYEAAAEYLRAEAKKIPLGEGNVAKGFSSTYNALVFAAETLERACAL